VYRVDTATAAAAIPSKFLVEKQAFPAANGFYPIVRSSEATTAEMSMGVTASTKSAIASKTAHMSTAAKFHDDLPTPPEWLVGLSAGLLAFGLAVAVVLYLANFPPTFSWIHKIWKQRTRRYGGYRAIEGHDSDEPHSRRQRKKGSRDLGSAGYSTATEHSGSNRKPHKKDLSINTSARYTGLGIAIPGDLQTGEMLRRQQKYDEEALRMRRSRSNSPVKAAWAAVTAPLPSISHFGQNVYNAVYGGAPHTTALTSAPYQPYDEEAAVEYSPTDYDFTPETAYHPALQYLQSPLYGPETKAEADGFFERVGGGMEHVAGRTARVFHDGVQGAEEGLLLHVKESEREGPCDGVMVDA